MITFLQYQSEIHTKQRDLHLSLYFNYFPSIHRIQAVQDVWNILLILTEIDMVIHFYAINIDFL